MTRPARRHVLFGAALALLVAAAVAAWLVDRRVSRSRRTFTVEAYDRTMRSIDAAIASISAHMAFDGAFADLDEALRVAATAPDPEPPADVPAPADAATPGPRLVLSSIMWSPQRPLAIVNGDIVGPGQDVDGYRVERIGEHSVTLRDGDGRAILLELYAP